MNLQEALANQIAISEVCRVLGLITTRPNTRHQPQPGDRQDRYFQIWFDGGASYSVTGGATTYVLDDGVEAVHGVWSSRLSVTIRWPDGRSVKVSQESDRERREAFAEG